MSNENAFEMHAKRVDKRPEYPPLIVPIHREIEVETDDGEVEVQIETREVVLEHPGEGTTTMFFMGMARGELVAAGETYEFLSRSMSVEDFRFLQQLIRDDELSFEDILPMIRKAMELWSTFPTKPSSVSHKPQRPTGTRSTGRSPGAGSTSKPSRSAG